MDWDEIINDLKLGSVFGSAVFIAILAAGLGWV